MSSIQVDLDDTQFLVADEAPNQDTQSLQFLVADGAGVPKAASHLNQSEPSRQLVIVCQGLQAGYVVAPILVSSFLAPNISHTAHQFRLDHPSANN